MLCGIRHGFMYEWTGTLCTYKKYLYFLKLQTVVPLYSWSTIVKLCREVVHIWCSICCKTHFQGCTFPTVHSSRNVITEHVTDNLMLKSILLLKIICIHAKDQWPSSLLFVHIHLSSCLPSSPHCRLSPPIMVSSSNFFPVIFCQAGKQPFGVPPTTISTVGEKDLCACAHTRTPNPIATIQCLIQLLTQLPIIPSSLSIIFLFPLLHIIVVGFLPFTFLCPSFTL